MTLIKKENYPKEVATNFNFSSNDFKNIKSKIRNYKNMRRKKQ